MLLTINASVYTVYYQPKSPNLSELTPDSLKHALLIAEHLKSFTGRIDIDVYYYSTSLC